MGEGAIGSVLPCPKRFFDHARGSTGLTTTPLASIQAVPPVELPMPDVQLHVTVVDNTSVCGLLRLKLLLVGLEGSQQGCQMIQAPLV